MKLLLSLLMAVWSARAFEVIAPEHAKEAWAHQAALELSKGLSLDVSTHIHPRIVGGSNAQAGRYPYYTYIEVRTNNGIYLCSATVIWEDILLTSAHCVVDLQVKGLIVEGVDAFVGLEDQNKLDTSEFRGVELAIPHPSYNTITKENDIMIFKLKDPVLTVSAVGLNFEPTIPADGARVDVFGFGVDSEELTALFPDKLQTVSMNVIPFADCNDANSFDGDINNNVMICAGSPSGGKDACDGDSGSPLIIPGDGPGSDVQVGIVSFGEGCGRADFPGVYTRISSFGTFLINQICNNSANKPLECSAGVNPEPSSQQQPSATLQPTAKPVATPTRSPVTAPITPTSPPGGQVKGMGGMGGMGSAGVVTNLKGTKNMMMGAGGNAQRMLFDFE